MSLSVAEKYGGILHQWCAERDVIEDVDESLAQVEALVEKSEEFRFVWLNPVIAPGIKGRILATVLEDEIPSALWNFLLLLIERGREDMLGAIAEQFRERVLESRGVRAADVYTAMELPPEVTEELREVLCRREAAEVLLRQHHDPSLLGGVVIRIDDLKMDGSLKGRLRNIRKVLSAASDRQMPMGRDENR
jgi:F-type H+-transporting ATPase subunit delta